MGAVSVRPKTSALTVRGPAWSASTGVALRKAFAKMVAIVVPAKSTVKSLTVEGAIRRLYDRQGVIRDALAAMLTEAVLLGVDHGWDDVERRMGIQDQRRAGRVSWDLIHAAALAWVQTGNTPAGLPDWGTGYGGVNSLTAQIVRSSEEQLRPLIAEWIVNGEPFAATDRPHGSGDLQPAAG